MNDEQDERKQEPNPNPTERKPQTDAADQDKVLNLDTGEYEDAKRDMQDDESIMDFGSGSGGGSAAMARAHKIVIT